MLTIRHSALFVFIFICISVNSLLANDKIGICIEKDTPMRSGKGFSFPVIHVLKPGDKVFIRQIDKENSYIINQSLVVEKDNKSYYLEKGTLVQLMHFQFNQAGIYVRINGRIIYFLIPQKALQKFSGYAFVRVADNGKEGWLFSDAITEDHNKIFQIGAQYHSQLKLQQAIEYYSMAIIIHPGFIDALLNRGSAYNDLGMFDKAINDYNIILSQAPQNIDAINNRGVVYIKMKQYERALKDYFMIISINSEYNTAYYNIACIYSLMAEKNKACEYLQKSISKGFKNWDIIKNDPDLHNIRNMDCYKKLVEGKTGK